MKRRPNQNENTMNEHSNVQKQSRRQLLEQKFWSRTLNWFSDAFFTVTRTSWPFKWIWASNKMGLKSYFLATFHGVMRFCASSNMLANDNSLSTNTSIRPLNVEWMRLILVVRASNGSSTLLAMASLGKTKVQKLLTFVALNVLPMCLLPESTA